MCRWSEERLQGRSKLEKAMQEWFDGEGQRTRFVLWGPISKLIFSSLA